MNDAEFIKLLGDSSARKSRYEEMIVEYYDRVTDVLRKKWSDSFHFAIFQGDEPLEKALAATELLIAKEGGFHAGSQVLDVGCGIGGPALTIGEWSGAHITGLNLHGRQVDLLCEKAAQRGLSDRTDFVRGDAMKMPFPDSQFDHVYVFEAICHMPDKERFCQECARVLRPGGYFLGLDWMKRDGLSKSQQETFIEPICRYHAIPYLVSQSELKVQMNAAGLEVEVVEDASGLGTLLPNWELLDSKVFGGIWRLAPWLIPPELRLPSKGCQAITTGVREGAFLIGHWRARRTS